MDSCTGSTEDLEKDKPECGQTITDIADITCFKSLHSENGDEKRSEHRRWEIGDMLAEVTE